jgi:hypothetical protein
MKKSDLLKEIYRVNNLPNKYEYLSNGYINLPTCTKCNLKYESNEFLNKLLKILKNNKGEL